MGKKTSKENKELSFCGVHATVATPPNRIEAGSQNSTHFKHIWRMNIKQREKLAAFDVFCTYRNCTSDGV
jgi:hypothetical protein